jgi:hypothetical protein
MGSGKEIGCELSGPRRVEWRNEYARFTRWSLFVGGSQVKNSSPLLFNPRHSTPTSQPPWPPELSLPPRNLSFELAYAHRRLMALMPSSPNSEKWFLNTAKHGLHRQICAHTSLTISRTLHDKTPIAKLLSRTDRMENL